MQESQKIQRAKTSELDILLYKQIPQIQLEFSEENAQLKIESEAKDKQVSSIPLIYKNQMDRWMDEWEVGGWINGRDGHVDGWMNG